MTALSAFIPEIAAACPNCPSPLMEQAIRRAATEFCFKTLWWIVKLDAVGVSAGLAQYSLSPPDSESIIAMVMDINYDGRKLLLPVTLDQLTTSYPEWESDEGDPSMYLQISTGELELVPVPEESAIMVATVALAPSRTTEVIDDGIYNYHFDTVVHGALWKLYEMPGKAWSDPQAALYHENLFYYGVNSAKASRIRSNSRANLRVDPVSFI